MKKKNIWKKIGDACSDVMVFASEVTLISGGVALIANIISDVVNKKNKKKYNGK